jgi:hypothetical protein
MSDASISPEAKFTEAFASDYLQQATVHLNFDQNLVIITEDRLHLCLRNHLECVESKKAWIAPVSLFVAFVTTLSTTTFKEAFGLSASTWQALFVLLAIVTFIWSFYTIVAAIKNKSSLRTLLDEIKKRAKVTTNTDQSHT